MPACTLYLLALRAPLSQFLSTLSSANLQPLTVAKVIRWIILPTTSTDQLLAQNISWDLLLILPDTSPLPSNLSSLIKHEFRITAGVPSRLLTNYAAKNKQLLHPELSSIPPLSGSLSHPLLSPSAQPLALTTTLQSWITSFSQTHPQPVSMLNLLAFYPDRKDQYLTYGRAFASSIGSSRGGLAKIVGTVIGSEGAETKEWDEIAVAHYPSILHFADMLASEDYQEVNQKYRVGSLRDTCILCTSELDLPAWGGESKL